jgi:hypothetical protein
VFTLLGTGGPGDYEYSLTFVNTARQTVTFGPALVRVAPGATIRDGELGRIIYDNLSADSRVTAEYNITWERGADLYFRVILTPKREKRPSVVRDGVRLSPGSQNLYLAAGVDPLSGDATFDLTGSATGTGGSGEVFFGVNGFVVDVPTSDSRGPKSLQQIKNELIADLVQLGFSGVYQDTAGEVVVPGVSTGGRVGGDIPDNDVGAAFMSTDAGVGGSAQMAASAMANPRPPRGTVTVSPGRGVAGTVVTVSISGFPASSTINITLNGAPVGTITTNAAGTGSTTFVAPAGPRNVPLEVRASGGTPLTFGYGWFTIT